LGKDRFLRSVACLPTFPEPVGLRPKAWIRGEVLDVLELARVIGHRDPRSLMIYYDADADALAAKLG